MIAFNQIFIDWSIPAFVYQLNRDKHLAVYYFSTGGKWWKMKPGFLEDSTVINTEGVPFRYKKSG